MIRAARFEDVPALAAMLRDMHARSKYAGRVAISEKAMDAVLTGMVAQQAQTGPQGSCCAIAIEEGRPAGFVVGLLDRVYHVGNKLVANDVYLWLRPGASPVHTLQLVRHYLRWARRIRAVLEIRLSWTDALPGAERLGRLYGRLGAARVGEIYEIRMDGEEGR